MNAAVQKLELHRIWPGKEKDGMGADNTYWCPRWLSSAYQRKFIQNVPPSFLHSHFHIYHKTIMSVFKTVHGPFLICQISFVTFRWLPCRIKLAHSASRPLSRCRRQVVMSGTKSSTVCHIMEKNRFHPLVLFSDEGRFHLRDTWTLRIALTYLQKCWCVVCSYCNYDYWTFLKH